MTPEEHKIWLGRIGRAQSNQDKVKHRWKTALKLYNTTYFDDEFGGFNRERVDVHFANWYINNVIYLTYSRDPYMFVKTENNRLSSFAATMERLLNKTWKQLSMKQHAKRAIHSASLMPPAWIKTGYTAKIGEDTAKLDKEKGILQKVKDALTDAVGEKKESSPEEQGVLNQYIEEERVFAHWVPSWNMLMPEGYHLLSDMPYLIEKETVARIDFRNNPLYKNKEGVSGASKPIANNKSGQTQLHSPTFDNTGSNSADGGDTETNTIDLFHIHDRRSKKRFTLSTEFAGAHFEGDWDEEDFPYEDLMFDETLPFNEVPNPYPPNLLEPIMSQIIEQSQARTQMVKWRKRASSIILVQRGSAGEEDIKQIEDTEAVQIVYVSNIEAFRIANTGNLPNQVFEVDKLIKQDLQTGTNMGQMMFAPQPGQRTATQASISQQGLEIKSSARVDMVEDFTVRIATQLARKLWTFYDKDKVAEILGEELTDDMWLPLPDDKKERKRILLDLQLSIEAGSAAPPKDESVERKQLMDAVSISASVAPESIKKAGVLKEIFKTFKHINNVDDLVKGNDEEEAQAAQQENELLEQNIPQVVSPNENHEVHVQVHSQGPQTEVKDQHLAEHGQRLGIFSNQKAQEGTVQEGDTRPAGGSVTPEITRQGSTDQGDLAQSVQSV